MKPFTSCLLQGFLVNSLWSIHQTLKLSSRCSWSCLTCQPQGCKWGQFLSQLVILYSSQLFISLNHHYVGRTCPWPWKYGMKQNRQKCPTLVKLTFLCARLSQRDDKSHNSNLVSLVLHPSTEMEIY